MPTLTEQFEERLGKITIGEEYRKSWARKSWAYQARLADFLAGAAAEREAVLQILAETDAQLATGWHLACQEIGRRICQRGEAGEGKSDDQQG